MTTDDRIVSMTPVEPLPKRRLDRADVAAVTVAWAGVALGLVVKCVFGGWMLFVILTFFPLTILLPLAGAFVVQRALLGTGTRRISERTRPWYRLLGWVTGLGVFLAYACVEDGGDVDDVGHSLLLLVTGWTSTPDWLAEVTSYVWMVGVGAAGAAIVLYLVERSRARRSLRADGAAI